MNKLVLVLNVCVCTHGGRLLGSAGVYCCRIHFACGAGGGAEGVAVCVGLEGSGGPVAEGFVDWGSEDEESES